MTGIDLKYLMLEKRVRQRRVAQVMKRSESYLSDFLTGQRELTPEIQEQIIKAINKAAGVKP